MTTTADSTAGEWLLSGIEPQPLGSITQCRVLRSDGISLLTTSSGHVDADEDSATGLYARDTRYLSRLRFSFNGVEPILLDSREIDGSLSATFTNPAIQPGPSGAVIQAQTLIVRRRTLVANGLLQRFLVSNYGRQPVSCELRIEFDADFHDIFEIRGFSRQSVRPLRAKTVGHDSVTFEYDGADGVVRTTGISFQPPPQQLSDSRAALVIPLEPRATAEVMVRVGIDGPVPARDIDEAGQALVESRRNWFDTVTSIETDSPGLNALLRQSLCDIHSLRTAVSGRQYIAAGVPWFDTLFGRDSLIAGMQLLAFCPGLLRESLLILAEYQAIDDDPARDSLPGKIPHELRWGELAQAGEVPFARYYGSVDSTPLFVMAVAEYMRWTNDFELLEKLWPNVQDAVSFLRAQAALGVKGFLSYARRTSSGLENQGWKDSHDAIVQPDGSHAVGPIALVEVQAYLAAALSGYAELAAIRGEVHQSALAAEESADLARRFDEEFGDERLGFALCLDGNGDPVPTPASNSGHALWTGSASPAAAARVVERLMQPDMFSGWGIRTLASSANGYNPLGYHVGSVWPHDNSLVLAGFRRYGHMEATEELGNALIAMALAFPEHRVPELFSGDGKELRLVPTPYPVASKPQAWAAASIPYVVASMLGIRPGLENQLLVSQPILPRGVNWLRMRRLRVGLGEVDLVFRRQNRGVSVEIEDLAQGVQVVLSREAWRAGQQ